MHRRARTSMEPGRRRRPARPDVTFPSHSQHLPRRDGTRNCLYLVEGGKTFWPVTPRCVGQPDAGAPLERGALGSPRLVTQSIARSTYEAACFTYGSARSWSRQPFAELPPARRRPAVVRFWQRTVPCTFRTAWRDLTCTESFCARNLPGEPPPEPIRKPQSSSPVSSTSLAPSSSDSLPITSKLPSSCTSTWVPSSRRISTS
jgi:hypothetical protein